MRKLCLAAFAASVWFTYGVFFTGDLVSGDNITQYYQTTQILDRHRFTFATEDVNTILQAHDFGLNTRFGVNRDGTHTPVYGFGQSLLTLPLFAALRFAKAAAHLPQPADMTLWALNWPVFGVLCVLLIVGACDLAGARSPGWLTLIPVAAAFSSSLWTFSTIPYNVLGETLCVLAAIDLCLWLSAGRGTDRAASLAAAGLALALTFGVAIRPFMASVIPAFILWFGLSQLRSTAAPLRKRRTAAAFALTLLVGAAVLAGINSYLFGSPLRSAYHDLGDVINFRGSWVVGITGTFLSPLKSPLYFFPMVVSLPATVAFLV